MFRTFLWNDEIQKNFDLLQQSLHELDVDLYISYDTTNSYLDIDYDKVYLFNNSLIEKRKWPYYKHHKKGPLWFNGDYTVVDFYLDNKQYDFIWLLEYDLTYNNWRDFFEITSEKIESIDFIGPWLKSNKYINPFMKHEPHWCWWNSCNTFFENMIGVYFPITGYSRKLLELLDKKYKEGIHGFCELIVPTLAFNNELNLVDLKFIYEDLSLIKHKNKYEFKY